MRCGVCNDNHVVPNEDGSIPDCSECVRVIHESEPFVLVMGTPENPYEMEIEIEDFLEDGDPFGDVSYPWGGDGYDQYDELGD